MLEQPLAGLKHVLTPVARSLPWVVYALCLPACTSVTVHAGDGSVAVHRGFGFLSLQPTPGTTPMVFHGITLGLQSGPWGHSLGYAQTRLTLLPPGCHVVVMPASAEQASRPTWQALREADPCAVPTTPRPGVD
jgi:hypothetical protein